MTHTAINFNPNVYVLGGKPEIQIVFKGASNQAIVPSEVRLSIKEPSGTIITISGGGLSTVASGVFTYLYRPPTIGWYEYESWGKDLSGREVADTSGFEIIDRLY